jgi:hypothetical protein
MTPPRTATMQAPSQSSYPIWARGVEGTRGGVSPFYMEGLRFRALDLLKAIKWAVVESLLKTSKHGTLGSWGSVPLSKRQVTFNQSHRLQVTLWELLQNEANRLSYSVCPRKPMIRNNKVYSSAWMTFVILLCQSSSEDSHLYGLLNFWFLLNLGNCLSPSSEA